MNRLETTSNGQTPDSGSTLSISRAPAAKFADKWKDTVEEKSHSQAFWQEFFRDLLGISDLREAGVEFEKKVISSKKKTSTWIDVYWKDTFLVEQKSAGKDLDAAEDQAREYVFSLPPAQRPPIVIVCDFARFRIVDYVLNKSHEFKLEELPDNLDRIEAIVSHKTNVATTVQVEADQKAAQLMADLYVQLEKYGYEGHEASVFMVRILFCLFADDTRMWKTGIFQDLVQDTNEQGSDLGPRLSTLFAVLDTPKDQRKGPQDPFLADFPYVNGGIFSERLDTVNFNAPMRQALLNACAYDWSTINPTIFGALFQDIKSKDERRGNGEHYTSEENIDKVINPIIMDDLHEKLEKSWDNSGKLKELQRELGTYQILDPACGCGNFLITTYKRLRQLELEIIVRIKQLDGTAGQLSIFDVKDDIHVKLEQLHGIEYVEWSSQIAKVAIYLTDHQENMKLESVLGVAANRFPLSHSANIVLGNSLHIDWAEVCPMSEKTMIIGNPPFIGSRLQTTEQRIDQNKVWDSAAGWGTTDYVTNWFVIAGKLISRFNCKVAFISTNSITQGDQPASLWGILGKLGLEISFAHRTFSWKNNAPGEAGVHCVVIGLAKSGTVKQKRLWKYETPESSPTEIVVSNINAYLIDGDFILVKAARKPLGSGVPVMKSGNKPRDGGFLSSIDLEEAQSIREQDSIAAKYLRFLVGGDELLNGLESRYCLWLVDASPSEISSSPVLKKKVEQVLQERLNATSSKGAAANRPALFEAITQPKSRFIAIPAVSSDKRKYIPVKFLNPDMIINNKLFTIESENYFMFAILQSRIFRVWVETVSSRLGSGYNFSITAVYNTFPFLAFEPELQNDVADLGRQLETARDGYPTTTLGDLYDPRFMPLDILELHQKIDQKLFKSYGLNKNVNDVEICEKLFSLYRQLSQTELIS